MFPSEYIYPLAHEVAALRVSDHSIRAGSWVITVTSMLIGLRRGFNLDDADLQSPLSQRVFGKLTNLLMQPGTAFWDSVGFTPGTSWSEWTAMIPNSLVWGVTLALVVLLVSRRLHLPASSIHE